MMLGYIIHVTMILSKRFDGHTHLCFAVVISEEYLKGTGYVSCSEQHWQWWSFGLLFFIAKYMTGHY